MQDMCDEIEHQLRTFMETLKYIRKKADRIDKGKFYSMNVSFSSNQLVYSASLVKKKMFVKYINKVFFLHLELKIFFRKKINVPM